jgi:hypothetical protein
MIVQHEEISSNHNYLSRHNNKSDTINVTKAAARKSILRQIARAKAANLYR